jgi:hypothetical protein
MCRCLSFRLKSSLCAKNMKASSLRKCVTVLRPGCGKEQRASRSLAFPWVSARLLHWRPLPQVVHAALQELDDDQMRIEVILPRELLELKIEGAPFPNGLDQVPIGFEWPVVVRSYDRLYDEQNFLLAKRKWKRKWRRLSQSLAASDVA